jgi:CheY-like chemotaxis protein
VSLRILFADDSVTAQNMGKKILTEAGYDVVAVSNGAAAVKKIAEQKPDIIILDLYMPGYSGLEVCEKVRASIATIKTPVLLTVGKMEPYKPEDANRVRADGVIIKPFEASDLLAIIKKFEERISQAPVAAAAPASSSAPPPTEQIPVWAPEPQAAEHPEPAMAGTAQPTVEVPDHMATSSAFSDLLGSDAAHAVDRFNVATPQRVPELEPAKSPVIPAAPLPEYDVPVAWQPEPEPVPPTPIPEVAPPMAPQAASPAPPASRAEEPAAPVAPRPRLIPVFQEPEKPQTAQYDFMPTGAAPASDIEIPREPHLQETAEETTRNTVADRREPGLIPTFQVSEERAEAGTTVEFALPDVQTNSAVADVASDIQVAPPGTAIEEPAIEAPATPPVSDNEFEARVAAAMAAYNHPPEIEPTPEAVMPVAPVAAVPEPPLVEETTIAADSSDPEVPAAAEIQPPPPVQYQQPPATPENHHGAAQPAAVASTAPVQEPAPVPVPSVQAEPESVPAVETRVEREEVAARVEAELPAASAAVAAGAGAEAGGDHQTIAQAVNRVMERVKGDLVEEILRELHSNKK